MKYKSTKSIKKGIQSSSYGIREKNENELLGTKSVQHRPAAFKFSSMDQTYLFFSAEEIYAMCEFFLSIDGIGVHFTPFESQAPTRLQILKRTEYHTLFWIPVSIPLCSR